MNKICFGCGAILQCDNPSLEGYIPKEKIDNSNYCQRCFRIINYGDYKEVVVPKDIKSILNHINKDNKHVLFLTDFITLNKDIINVFNKITKNKTLVISKCDIIPKNISYDKIINILRSYYKIDSDIFLISSFSGFGVSALLDYLENNKINESYLIGLSNSGKSTLINKMIEIKKSNLRKLTTSYKSNTTLNYIRLKLDDNLTIIDSPGFILDNKVDYKLDNKNTIQKVLKPITYQMKEGEILLVGDMYFRFNNSTSITLYMNNNINIKKYFKDIDFTNKVNVNDNTDLIIKGLGFMNIKTSNVIDITNNKELLETRPSIFGGKNG